MISEPAEHLGPRQNYDSSLAPTYSLVDNSHTKLPHPHRNTRLPTRPFATSFAATTPFECDLNFQMARFLSAFNDVEPNKIFQIYLMRTFFLTGVIWFFIPLSAVGREGDGFCNAVLYQEKLFREKNITADSNKKKCSDWRSRKSALPMAVTFDTDADAMVKSHVVYLAHLAGQDCMFKSMRVPIVDKPVGGSSMGR